ncbi:MAG: glycosyltransferase [Anaerolineae bacterium]|nr:glycosyltransferase [Anaerolineae bacterium]
MDTQVRAVTTTRTGLVLLVDDEDQIRKLVSIALRRAGYEVMLAVDGLDALAQLAEITPDLIVSDVMMPNLDGFGLLARLRENAITRTIPVIMLTARGATEDIVAGLGLGADDYLAKPFQMSELVARVQAKIARPPVPSDLLPHDRQTGLLSERVFWQEVERESTRAERSGRPGSVAVVQLNELAQLRDRLAQRSVAQIAKQIAQLLSRDGSPLEVYGRLDDDQFAVLMPDSEVAETRQRLETLTQRIVRHVFQAGEERLRLTPIIGYTLFSPGVPVDTLGAQASTALSIAASHLDLEPQQYTPAMDRAVAQRQAAARVPWWPRARERLRLPFQIALTLMIGLVLPFLLYAGLDAVGLDITPAMYLVVVVALLLTGCLIWVEGFRALRVIDPPQDPATPYPPASAIIAAYLPNEAATVVETVEAFLRIEYPAPLQIILAYNTPRPLPVEGTLREIAQRDPRFVPFRVEGSTSKAQNVNAALAEVTGEFVGVFDADHQPDPDSYSRAWRWLSDGYDVVQGHCVVRNGDESWVARLIAVEFEAIYAVAHPGRARLHGFGIFGGSNGYWKTDLLRQTRMHGFMLTEDIDSSLRVTEAGHRIASDPHLLSRELAPVTVKALWNQRMRWAQGWFQVSMKHVGRALRSPHLTARQKLGLLHLLGWREIYPWLAFQMIPIVAYWAWRAGGLDKIDWFVPIFILTSLFTLTVGPGQTLFAYWLAVPELRQRRNWFWFYLLMASLFYTEFKNMIARVAQVKEAMHERQWKVTPRATTPQRQA